MNIEERCAIIPCRTLSEQDHQALSLLYAPLIRHEALNLYETMLALSKSAHPVKDHEPFVLLGYSVERMEQLRQILERFLLLRTFMDPHLTPHMCISSARPWRALSFCVMRCWAGCI